MSTANEAGNTVPAEDSPETMLGSIVETLQSLDARRLEEVSRIVAAPPVLSPVVREIEAGNGDGTAMLASGRARRDRGEEEIVPVPDDYDFGEIIAHIKQNAWQRARLRPAYRRPSCGMA